MEPKEFLFKHENELLQVLRDYLGGRINHQEASDYAWSVIDECEQVGIPKEAAHSEKERVFWAAIWSLQHLADEEHWSENVTQPELRKYIDLLASGKSLPPGDSALRPGAG